MHVPLFPIMISQGGRQSHNVHVLLFELIFFHIKGKDGGFSQFLYEEKLTKKLEVFHIPEIHETFTSEKSLKIQIIYKLCF